MNNVKIPEKFLLKELTYKYNFNQIAKMYNVGKTTVYRWCKHYNLPYHRDDLKHIKFITAIKTIHPNLNIIGTYIKAHQNIKTQCLKCDHVWFPLPTNLLSRHGCPMCNRYNQKLIEDILYNLNYKLEGIYKKVNYRTKIKCLKCDYSWNPFLNNIIYLKTSCPNCTRILSNNGFNKFGEIKKNYLEYSLQNLLKEEFEAYYWIGFLMADAHFNNNGRIILQLAEKDSEHVQKFAQFIEYKKPVKNRIAIMQKGVSDKIKEKFSISHIKTYEPCNIFNISSDALFVSLFIGFIDGDGCIGKMYKRQNCYITIKLHKNWSNNLYYMIDRIYKINSLPMKPILHYRGNHVYMNFSNKTIIKYLKDKTIEYKLPVLKRKWDKIE